MHGLQVEAVEGGVRDSGDSVLLPVDLDEYSIENEFYKLIVDPTKGLISTVVLKRLNTQMPFRQSIWKYYAYQVGCNIKLSISHLFQAYNGSKLITVIVSTHCNDR